MTIPIRNRSRFSAPVLRVSTGRAILLFAVVGGIFAGLQGMTGLYRAEGVPILALIIAGGLIPWAVVGALYARFANKGDRDVAELGTWARYGAKAGAVMLAASGLFGFFIALPFVFGKLPFALLLIMGPVAVIVCAAVGALQGALAGMLVGNFVVTNAVQD